MLDYLFKNCTSLRNCNVASSQALILGGASEQLSGSCFQKPSALGLTVLSTPSSVCGRLIQLLLPPSHSLCEICLEGSINEFKMHKEWERRRKISKSTFKHALFHGGRYFCSRFNRHDECEYSFPDLWFAPRRDGLTMNATAVGGGRKEGRANLFSPTTVDGQRFIIVVIA